MKKTNIFVGHYGSGKTEVAVNFAINNKVSFIADLDTVNPYFRTNDAKEVLEKKGIRVVAPYFAGTNVDIPALSPEIYSAFAKGVTSVLDVGGDDDGASVLGRFNDYIKPEETEMYLVINVFRPDTANEDGIIEMISAIEGASRLKITALINNSNLLQLTEVSHIEHGERIVKCVSEKTGIRFAGTTAMENVMRDGDYQLNKYIKML